MSRRPVPSSKTVSRQMSRMPRADTKPETLLRSELHRRGLRFHLHGRHLPGRPDIVFTRARIAVFVDGCFWHSCPTHGVLPKSNRDWWREKLRLNTERDVRKDEELRAAGWVPLHTWEHEPVEAAAERIEALWRMRTGRASLPGLRLGRLADCSEHGG